MKIHFVTESEQQRWVLRPIAEDLASRIVGATVGTEIDSRADVNIFVNYALYQPTRTKTIGFFTHREFETRAAQRFNDAAQGVDWCLAMCELTAAKLPAEKTSIIQVYPHEQFHKGNLVLGVVGREYHSGRKRFHWVRDIQAIEGVEVQITGGNLAWRQLPDFYRSIDYLLVLTENTGGPVPLLEALAMGKPVIAPNVGFCWDYPVIRYEDKAGLLRLIQKLLIPIDGWDCSAKEVKRVCEELL